MVIIIWMYDRFPHHDHNTLSIRKFDSLRLSLLQKSCCALFTSGWKLSAYLDCLGSKFFDRPFCLWKKSPSISRYRRVNQQGGNSLRLSKSLKIFTSVGLPEELVARILSKHMSVFLYRFVSNRGSYYYLAAWTKTYRFREACSKGYLP